MRRITIFSPRKISFLGLLLVGSMGCATTEPSSREKIDKMQETARRAEDIGYNIKDFQYGDGWSKINNVFDIINNVSR